MLVCRHLKLPNLAFHVYFPEQFQIMRVQTVINVEE